MEEIKSGVLHCHSENSLMDGTCKIPDLVKKAKEYGSRAVALTDHGVMSGTDEFISCCMENGIQPIPGVEAYFMDGEKGLRSHLIIMAKNNAGYKSLARIVTASNGNYVSGYPIVTWDMLEKNKDGIIVTSACMNGPLAKILLGGFIIDQEIEKAKKRIARTMEKKNVMSSEDYAEAVRYLCEAEKKLSDLTEEKKVLVPVSKKTGLKEKKALEAKAGSPDYDLAKGKYDEFIAARDKAVKRVHEITAEMKEISSKVSELKKKKDIYDSVMSKSGDAEKLQMTKKTPEEYFEDASLMARKFQKLFGNDFYIELQYHGIAQEKYIMPRLAVIAEKNDIPVVAANDVHVVDNTEDSFKTRQIIRSLRMNDWEEEMVGDREVYLKTDKELSDKLSEILPAETVLDAMNGIDTIVSACNFKPDNEKHYPKFDKSGQTDPDETLKRLAYAGIKTHYPDNWDEVKQKRLDYELSVIKKMGYSDYHLIVADFILIGKKLGKLSDESVEELYSLVGQMTMKEMTDYIDKHATEVGIGVGPGRGSAAGSIVCYLTGITDIDPIKYDLLFERFLNPERISMPDIDTDYKKDIRDLVVWYVEKKYGINAVCRILTKTIQGPKGAIHSAARILESKHSDQDKKYFKAGNELANLVPDEINTAFNTLTENGSTVYESIVESCRTGNADADRKLEIMKTAKLLEGCPTSYGFHAAGVIISDNDNIGDNIPLMWNKESGWKTQCDMVEAEDNGYLKMDFLGLRNLNILTCAARSVYRRTGIAIDFDKIPLDDPNVYSEIYGKANTNSVFQFESAGIREVLRDFAPTCLQDIVMVNALYRPGPMDLIPDCIKGKKDPRTIRYLCPELKPILDETYGTIVYQEQVMRIFQDLAGFSLGQADMVRRYMSKKKHEKLAHEKEAFIHGDPERGIKGCVSNGISETVADTLFQQIEKFASYAFNKSHATAYSVVSYFTAYMKYYYPADFLCAALSYATVEKIPGLIEDAKNFGITVLRPDINKSEVDFSVEDENTIRFGLKSIKQVAGAAKLIIQNRKENGEFISLVDFLSRTGEDTGKSIAGKRAAEPLICSGAMDSFTDNRQSYVNALDDMVKLVHKQNEKTAIIKDSNSTEKQIENAKKSLERIKTEIAEYPFTMASENYIKRLEDEKDALGVYVTGHPLDLYAVPDDCRPISELSAGRYRKAAGIIKDYRFYQKEGREMAFFKLEDKSGVVDIKCFNDSFRKLADSGIVLKDGAALEVTGICRNDEKDPKKDERLSIAINTAALLKEKHRVAIVHLPICFDIDKIKDKIELCEDPDGYSLLVHETITNTIHKPAKEIYVNKSLKQFVPDIDFN